MTETNSGNRIVAGGGWTTRTIEDKPTARLLRRLSAYCLFLSIPSALLLLEGPNWDDVFTFIPLAAVALQVTFLVLWAIYSRAERTRLIDVTERKHDYTSGKLY